MMRQIIGCPSKFYFQLYVTNKMTKQSGPGTELKRLLQKFGITAKSCRCDQYVQLMDQQGYDWCLRNIELIVDWLEEEAEKRELTFFRIIGKGLVKRAVRNARKQGAKE